MRETADGASSGSPCIRLQCTEGAKLPHQPTFSPNDNEANREDVVTLILTPPHINCAPPFDGHDKRQSRRNLR